MAEDVDEVASYRKYYGARTMPRVAIVKNCFVRTCAAVTFMACGLAQNGTGKISGIVKGSDGKPLIATISVNAVGKQTPGAVVPVQSAADGSFSLGGLAAGSYQLCALVDGGGYLDPCAWTAPGFPVQLATGQAVTGHRLILEKASTLQVRVNDPSGVLDKIPEVGKETSHVLVGIFTSRHLFQPLGITNKDQTGKDLEGAIPFDRPVSLHLVGKSVQLTDVTGATVDLNGATVSVKHVSGMAPPPRLIFNVAPKKP